MSGWRRRRAIWTVLLAIAPWAFGGFVAWDWNAANWDAIDRGIVAGLGVWLGGAFFFYPGWEHRA